MITSFFAPKKSPNKKSNSSNEDNPVKNDCDIVSSKITTTSTPSTSNEKKNTTITTVTPTSSIKKSKLSRRPRSKEVDELLKYMDNYIGDGDDDDDDDDTWFQALSKHTSSPRFAALAKFVSSERSSQTIYPPPQDTFSALNLTPLPTVKVVIVGQDPYHGPNQGHGLAFSVRRHVPPPPSLKNIFKELCNDVPSVATPQHGYLERWARQGVLMLNTVLTVRRGVANSHAKKGWEDFTDEVIRVLNRKHSHLVFLLWGRPAAKKAETIIDGRRHTVIKTSHPSPLGASKTTSPFLGSRCFSRVNEVLRERGLDEIDWNVDG